MLQQTTAQAVTPFFERFIARFPNLDSLADAQIGEVLDLWQGLGYYTRARNLHQTARLFRAQGVPRSFKDLLAFPGLGPYTARAVASFAFDERVGVLDGNVIRVISRLYDLEVEHWKPAGRAQLQSVVDEIIYEASDPATANQALMELGATLCTPRAYQCFTCPWFKNCVSRQKGRVDLRPLSKPRKKMEIWLWKPFVPRRAHKIAITQEHKLPFMKKAWNFPGEAKLLQRKPEEFDLRHTITHHDIFVKVQDCKKSHPRNLQWIDKAQLNSWNPSILLRKVLDHSN